MDSPIDSPIDHSHVPAPAGGFTPRENPLGFTPNEAHTYLLVDREDLNTTYGLASAFMALVEGQTTIDRILIALTMIGVTETVADGVLNRIEALLAIPHNIEPSPIGQMFSEILR